MPRVPSPALTPLRWPMLQRASPRRAANSACARTNPSWWAVKRAQYDIQHKDHSGSRWKLAEEASNTKGIERDVVIQDKLLSVLYVKRRQDINDPGIGDHELERLSGCPREHLEFHLWYMKAKGWIGRLENGMLAITVEGVDRANFEHRREGATKLLTHPNHTG